MTGIVVTGLWTRSPNSGTDTNFTIYYPDGTSSTGNAQTTASAGSALVSAGEQWRGGSRSAKSFTQSPVGTTGYAMSFLSE